MYRFLLRDITGYIIVFPLGSEFKIDWSSRTDGWHFYQKDFPSSIVFINDDFNRFLAYEKSANRCEFLYLSIERFCNKAWVEIFSGKISMNSGKWDLGRRKVTFSFDERPINECFEENKSNIVDLLDKIPVEDRVSVNLLGAGVTLEVKECSEVDSYVRRPDMAYWCGDNDPKDTGWQAFYAYQVGTWDPGQMTTKYNRQTKWVREVIIQPCSDFEPGAEWILIYDNCLHPEPSQQVRKYARMATVTNCEKSKWFGEGFNPPFHELKECDVLGMGGEDSLLIPNGMLLSDILQVLADATCPGYTVKSDFFQINPDVSSSINYFTGRPSKVNHLICFQKSDVKRMDSSDAATKAEFTFDKMMQALRYMFNTKFTIEGDFIRVEHLSYFQNRGVGLDLTQEKYKRYLVGSDRYSYNNDEIYEREEWTWSQNRVDGDFKGVPILYKGGCITKKDSVNKYPIEGIGTDLQWIMSSSEDSQASDVGLVMVATSLFEEAYHIRMEEGILEDARINNSLATSHLLRDYHRFGRPLASGIMNNVPTSFSGVIPSKKGESISVPLSCGDHFEPLAMVKTHFGLGIVSKASYTLRSGMLELELLY